MYRAMINCNQVQTEVISEGRWIEEDRLPQSSRDVVLVIPGNPGVPRFYEQFIKVLRSRLTSDTPVWLIGHAGHVQPPKHLDIAMPGNDKWTECYGLTAQIRHKVEFIKRYVPEDARLHVIGHSIGAWITLNLLKDHDMAKRIKKCYLLFPTIERMAESCNGKFFRYFMSPLAPLAIFISWIIAMIFPLALQVLLVRIFALFYGIPAKSIRAVQDVIDPRVVRNMSKLADEEMKCVQEADHDTISKHIDKLWLYYGASDKWVPVKYYRNMMSKHPDLDAQLCQRGLRHSFVLGDDVEMGNIVGDLVNENSSH